MIEIETGGDQIKKHVGWIYFFVTGYSLIPSHPKFLYIWSQEDCYRRYSIESEKQINECWIEDYKEIKDVIKNQDNG